MDELKRNASGYYDPTAYEALKKIQREGTVKAIDFLKQIKNLNDAIENKQEEIDYWRDMASSVTAQMGGEKVQATSNPQKMTDAVDRYMELEQEKLQLEKELSETRETVISLIGQLDKELERTVLYKRYVLYKKYNKLGKIANKINYSYQYTVEVHNSGLKNLQKILNNL